MKRLSLLALVIALTSSSCGNVVNVEVIGKTAITVDNAGKPVMLIEVCDGHIDTLVLARTREGLADDEPNAIEGTWDAVDPHTGTVEVNVGTATTGWQGPQIGLNSGQGYILEGTSSTAEVVTSQVTFTAAQVTTLRVNQVISGDGTISERAAFKASACPT